MAAAKDEKKTRARKAAKRATEARDATKTLRGRRSDPSTRTKAAAKKPAAPAKRAVARPITRAVVRPAPEKPREERPVEASAPTPAPKPKAEQRPLPTSPVAGEVPLIAADGSVSGSMPLPPALAEAKKRAGVLFQALDIAASNAHLGTSATKNRARVSGGGSKPWRQKGTGRARQGSTRAPHWRHGGVAFGPNGRRYQRRIPEKMRREAFGEAFAARAGAGRVLVYEGMRFEDDRPRTKTVVEWIGKLGDAGTVLLVTPEVDETTARAAANVQGVAARSVGALRTADLLRNDTLVVRRDALDALASRVGEGPREKKHGGAA